MKLLGVMGLLGGALILTACGASSSQSANSQEDLKTAGLQPPTPTPRTYTSQQTAAFRNYLKQAMSDLGSSGTMADNFSFNWNDATEDRWAQVETQAQRMCNTADSSGWSAAVIEFRTNALEQLDTQMQEELGQGISEVDEGLVDRVLDPLINVYLNAVTAVGSYCPDIPGVPSSAVPKAEMGISGLATKSAEDAYVTAFRDDPILGPLASGSTDQQLIAMSVPVCVGKQDEGMTRRENIDSYVDIGIDPLFAEKIVDLSLQNICP